MIQIAIMGLGTVGTGVAKVVAENARQIERKLGEPLQVKTILVRHFKDGPYRQLMTDDFTKIEEDHAIRVVVETIGGVEAAYEYTKRALNAGKHVVTANKQLVAEKGAELLALAKKQGVNYLFEASVGGGIPVLHPLTQCMAANRIDEVYGILNGTTNYILTRMVRAGTTFADALKEAQEKGYAEADPTADVEGVDAGRKICILADLAFGCQVDPADVPMEGISRLSLRLSGGPGGWPHGGDQPAASPGREERPAGGLPRQAAGPGGAPARRPYRLCGTPSDPGGAAPGQRGRCVQRGGGPGKRHRRSDVLRPGGRGAAHGLRLRGGRDGGASVQPPPGGDRLGGGPGGL